MMTMNVLRLQDNPRWPPATRPVNGLCRLILGLYPATDEQTLTDFAAWRKKMGR
jgi:hypothetical protein